VSRTPRAPAAQDRTLEVKVRPRSAVRRLEGPDAEGVWHAWLKSPPVEGRANEELIALVAETLGCRRSAVSIRSGAASRLKRVRIEGG
jgi:uncharacterized protein YggU (UPF0235/DUF167 family)